MLNINELSQEILETIFQKVDRADLLNIRLVCRRFEAIGGAERVLKISPKIKTLRHLEEFLTVKERLLKNVCWLSLEDVASGHLLSLKRHLTPLALRCCHLTDLTLSKLTIPGNVCIDHLPSSLRSLQLIDIRYRNLNRFFMSHNADVLQFKLEELKIENSCRWNCNEDQIPSLQHFRCFSTLKTLKTSLKCAGLFTSEVPVLPCLVSATFFCSRFPPDFYTRVTRSCPVLRGLHLESDVGPPGGEPSSRITVGAQTALDSLYLSSVYITVPSDGTPMMSSSDISKLVLFNCSFSLEEADVIGAYFRNVVKLELSGYSVDVVKGGLLCHGLRRLDRLSLFVIDDEVDVMIAFPSLTNRITQFELIEGFLNEPGFGDETVKQISNKFPHLRKLTVDPCFMTLGGLVHLRKLKHLAKANVHAPSIASDLDDLMKLLKLLRRSQTFACQVGR